MEELPELGHLNVKRVKDLLGTGEITMVLRQGQRPVDTHSHTGGHHHYLPRVDESDNGPGGGW